MFDPVHGEVLLERVRGLDSLKGQLAILSTDWSDPHRYFGPRDELGDALHKLEHAA